MFLKFVNLYNCGKKWYFVVSLWDHGETYSLWRKKAQASSSSKRRTINSGDVLGIAKARKGDCKGLLRHETKKQADISQRKRPTKSRTRILWPMYGSSTQWSAGLQIGTSCIFQDTPSVSCIMSQEICGFKLQSSNHITRIGWRWNHLDTNKSILEHHAMLAMSTHYQGSFDPMVRYITKGCYLGTIIYFTTISTSSTLRTRMLLKGEGMLGYFDDPLLYQCTGLKIPLES